MRKTVIGFALTALLHALCLPVWAQQPFEQPIKFEFIINLKAAKQISLTIPPSVLARADRVIR